VEGIEKDRYPMGGGPGRDSVVLSLEKFENDLGPIILPIETDVLRAEIDEFWLWLALTFNQFQQLIK
jgi:hypothetical protein